MLNKLKNKFGVIIGLSFVAIINASYLTYTALTFHPSFCDLNEALSCSASLTNPATNIFGLPFPALALVAYPVILFLALWGVLTISVNKKKNIFKSLFLLSGGGIIFNFYFIYQEYLLGVFCILCLLCSVIIVSIFIISFLEIIKNIKQKQ